MMDQTIPEKTDNAGDKINSGDNNDSKSSNKYNIPDDFIYDDHDVSGLID